MARLSLASTWCGHLHGELGIDRSIQWMLHFQQLFCGRSFCRVLCAPLSYHMHLCVQLYPSCLCKYLFLCTDSSKLFLHATFPCLLCACRSSMTLLCSIVRRAITCVDVDLSILFPPRTLIIQAVTVENLLRLLVDQVLGNYPEAFEGFVYHIG